jgi:GT2 family glycosyltransferase
LATEPRAPDLHGQPPEVSVVIVNLDGAHLLDACLDALLAQHVRGGFEVTLVDNGSHDGSVAHVRRRHPGVQVVEAGRNLGFAAGNNLGFRHCRGRFIVTLNNDTRVRPGCLQAMVDAADEERAAGAVTAKLVFASAPGKIQNAGSLLLSDGSGADRGAGEPDDGRYDRSEEVFGFCGAGALLRREMLDDVGWFDPAFFMYYEDTDLSWRMRLRGWRVLYEPRAVIEHEHAASSREWSPLFAFHVDRNRLFTILKNARLRLLVRAYWRLLRRVVSPVSNSERPGMASRPPPAAGRVLLSFLGHLPAMLVRRGRIRLRRCVPDQELERWLYPRAEWDARSR